MIDDTKTGCIYVLGRLSDGDEVNQSEEGGGESPDGIPWDELTTKAVGV